MSLILPNSRDVGNKFLFGHFMMRQKYSGGRKMEGPCYGRVNAWCSDHGASYSAKLEKEMDYMEQVGCNGYMIELCAHTAANEPKRWNNDPDDPHQIQAWLREVEEKYNTFLKLIRKHKKMWALVSVFNDNAWQRGVGPTSEITNKIIDIVAKAGHSDIICILPVGEPESAFHSIAIERVHAKLGGFKLLKEHYGDSSTSYWNWYSSDTEGSWSAPNKKLYNSSDGGRKIQDLCGYGGHAWVPEFPNLSGDPHAEKISYDYRGVPGRTSSWARQIISNNRTVSAIYYAWGYDGNNDGTVAGDDHCRNGIDVYAICGDVVGHDMSIPSEELDQKAKDLVEANGGDVTLY